MPASREQCEEFKGTSVPLPDFQWEKGEGREGWLIKVRVSGLVGLGLL